MSVINVTIHRDAATGLLITSSADLPGLTIAGRTMEEIESELVPVAEALLDARLSRGSDGN